MDIKRFTEYREKVVSSVSRAIVGKERQIELVLKAFVCSGHVLLEDVPGTGKTMLLRAFAKSMGGAFRRVQFTPDLLPSDLTGINFFSQKTGEFEFRKGPLFADVVLADEINRATPRTQSALLEAMEERQISVDGDTYPLGEDFIVMATQNPLESYGTFPLPEAQVDRFFMKLSLGYMTRLQEMQVLTRQATTDIIAEIQPVVTREETHYVKTHFREVEVGTDVRNYLMDLVEKTRKESQFISGVSTRGALALYKACQVNAAFAGRDYVLPEDIRDVARPVLGHRIFSGGGARAQEAELLLDRMIGEIPVPLEKK
ncbi:MAG: AAA family ATPase [Clostridiales bacterium]|nr:AAA family ATPase [Clostridiales bacterium]